jgi:uncharacterized protein (DUF1330 family)
MVMITKELSNEAKTLAIKYGAKYLRREAKWVANHGKWLTMSLMEYEEETLRKMAEYAESQKRY